MKKFISWLFDDIPPGCYMSFDLCILKMCSPNYKHTHLKFDKFSKLMQAPSVASEYVKPLLLNIYNSNRSSHLGCRHAGQKHILKRDSNAKLRFIECRLCVCM